MMNQASNLSEDDMFTNASKVAFWGELNAGFSITDKPFSKPAEQYHIAENEISEHLRQFKKEGYFQARPLIPEADAKRMADCIKAIVDKGFPPVFAFVYDEFWLLYKNLSQVLAPIFGEDYKLAVNVWAWYVPPNDAAAGFKPHRDYVGIDTVRDDGLPKMGTVWIPLTDVSTLNSCMYVLPANLDPCVPHNLKEQNIAYGDLQNIRALPAKAGSVLSWSTHVLHWGSRSSEFCKEPRISIATYLERNDESRFDGFLLNPALHFPLEYRLTLIAQVINHYNEEPLSYDRFPKALLRFCEKYMVLLPEVRQQVLAHPKSTSVPPQNAPIVASRSSQKPVKPGRNELCQCGSGKKFKHCHGQTA